MDTAINKNGDMALRDGMPYSIGGTDELIQRVYIALSAKKGGFIYDRELGSRIFEADCSEADADVRLEAKAREALKDMPFAEVTGASYDDGEACVRVELAGREYEIKLREERNGTEL